MSGSGGQALRPAVKQTPPLDPADEALIQKVADHIVRRGLTVPAVFFLESSKPLSYVGSQGLIFLEPFVRAFLSLESYNRFVRLIENRDNYETLIRAIEAEDAASGDRRRQEKARDGDPASGRRGWRRWFRRGGGH